MKDFTKIVKLLLATVDINRLNSELTGLTCIRVWLTVRLKMLPEMFSLISASLMAEGLFLFTVVFCIQRIIYF